MGILESINPAASELFSYESVEVIGNNISMLMPERRRWPVGRENDRGRGAAALRLP
ncbi:hypothetical protein [Sphingobacterium pedocola]|uniref:PAS domain-containing protein n=1 Tax=Sphingobacterium pedocola TaxID=2082722 RepID=A0ABR9TCS0_9SPHI|nr:hypothetical protein [Sphingobacterium pedocola]